MEETKHEESAPLWLLVMRRYDGLRELVGGELNPVVRELLTKYTRFPPAKITATTSWCSALVSACLEQAGSPSTHSAAAISYEVFGVPSDPFRKGSILVFGRRDALNPQARHVGLSEGRFGEKLLVRGGNQGNRCCVVERDPADLTASRWPKVHPGAAE